MDNIKKFSKQLRKTLESDVKKLKQNIGKEVAQQISKELKNEAQFVIKQFYNDYDPYSYERHYNFFKTYHGVARKIGGDKYLAGVRFTYPPDEYRHAESNSFYESSYHVDAPMNVFHRVYYMGLHGTGMKGYRNRDGIMPISLKDYNMSPMQRIYQKRDEIIKNFDIYQDIAYQKAIKKPDYEIISKTQIGSYKSYKPKSTKYERRKHK